jgi:hypothetical protein
MIAESYGHTLIPRSSHAVPTAAQVEQFVNWILAAGVVPANPQPHLAIIRGYQDIPNPFTGAVFRMLKKESRPIDPNQIAHAVASLSDYEISLGAGGVPKLPPLPLPADAPREYHVEMTIVVSSWLRSTSDTYNGFDLPLVDVPQFGEPISAASSKSASDVGYFSNMHTGTLIEVAGAGAARFTIEFELGKFLFPPLTDHLELLAPEIVRQAEQTFATQFAQGLHWGA